jgi:hypothetical protein
MALLVRALESKKPVLSAAALHRYPTEAAQLRAGGFIRPGGHEPVATSTDDGDNPVALQWSIEDRAYGYFNQTRGWLNLAEQEIQSFSLALTKIIDELASNFQLAAQPPVELVANHVWELGLARLGRKAHRTPLLFGRRLRDGPVWTSLKTALRERPTSHRKLIITTTASDKLSERSLPNCAVVAIGQMIIREAALTLDASLIAMRMDELPGEDEQGPFWVNADCREVHFYGSKFSFAKGLKQRDVIRVLYAYHLRGERQVSSAKIISDLDWDPKTRLRDIFKGHPAWGHLLIERSGMCGFCFRDQSV